MKTPPRHNRTSFFKYMTSPVARIVLTTRTMRWNSPQIFDDPFDVPINLKLPFKAADLQHAVVQRVADLFAKDGPFAHSQLAALAARMRSPDKQSLREEIIAMLRAWPLEGLEMPTLKEIQGHWEKLRPDMRILCVRESNKVTPMWAN